MKKSLLELNTEEFVAVLLGISPTQRISIHLKGEDVDDEDELVGTYEQISGVLEKFPELHRQFEEKFFDYNMSIDETETMQYLQHRTQNFNPELTQSLLQDFDFAEFMLFDDVEAQKKDRKEYESWKSTCTYCYYRAKGILQAKCTEFRRKKLLVPAPFEYNGIQSCGIEEVDRLLHSARFGHRSLSKTKFDADITSFKKECYTKARGNLSRAEKEKWIIDVVSVLEGAFKLHKTNNAPDFVNQSVHLLAVLEAAFMSAPELICIKDICIQLGMCDILDEQAKDEHPEGLPSRAELGLDPLTFEELHLSRELGHSAELKQKNLCEQCAVSPCHYQYGRRRFYLCRDEEYSKALADNRKAQRMRERFLPSEAIEEIVTDSLHGLKCTPLQEILEIFNNGYWLSLIEGYLRRIGDSSVPKLPDDESKIGDPMYRDKFLFFPPDCQDEFKRWRPLYDELRGVAERNAGDKVAIMAYFSDLVQPIKKYSKYFYPDKSDPNSSKMSKVLLKIATCDLIPEIQDVWSLYPDALFEVQNRPDAKSFSDEEFDDALYRSLYEKLRRNRSKDGGPSTWAIDAINDLIKKYGALIDLVLNDCGTGFRLSDIQSTTGIILVEDLSTIKEEISFYWENDTYQSPVVFAEAEEKGDSQSRQVEEGNAAQSGQADEIDLSPKANELLDKAKTYFVNGKWHNNDKKEYAIFLKTFFCRLTRKDWTNNVRWISLPIHPLADGTTLTISQLKGALRSYDESMDGGVRARFESILK